MKKLCYLLNGLASLALIVLFSQCAGNSGQPANANPVPANGVSGLKIAYVDDLNKQKQEFQTKYQNNAFLSQERAQQEYNRIAKLEQDLQELSNKLQSELVSENEKNSLQLRDSINNFLKEYNKTKSYDFIISNTGFDNLLYANEAYNITQEVLEGLNARYVKK